MPCGITGQHAPEHRLRLRRVDGTPETPQRHAEGVARVAEVRDKTANQSTMFGACGQTSGRERPRESPSHPLKRNAFEEMSGGEHLRILLALSWILSHSFTPKEVLFRAFDERARPSAEAIRVAAAVERALSATRFLLTRSW